jgi:hypothetical protein
VSASRDVRERSRARPGWRASSPLARTVLEQRQVQFSANSRSTRCTRPRSKYIVPGAVIPETETQIGANLTRAVAYPGDKAATPPLSTIGCQGQRLGPETPHHRSDQTRTAPPLGTASAGPNAAFISRRLNVLKAHSLTVLGRRRTISWSNRPDYSAALRHPSPTPR